MQTLHPFKADFILLAESGFIAVNQGDEDAAVKLFKAAALLDPSHILPQLGIGYVHLCKLELKQAAKLFEELLAKDPSNQIAKTFLGLALSLNPAELIKGEKVLEEMSSKAGDPGVKTLAKTALDFVAKFVKKTPTPTQQSSSPVKDKTK